MGFISGVGVGVGVGAGAGCGAVGGVGVGAGFGTSGFGTEGAVGGIFSARGERGLSDNGINGAGGNSFFLASSFASCTCRSPNHGLGAGFSGIGGLTSRGEKGLSPISRFPSGVGNGSPMGRGLGIGFGVSGAGFGAGFGVSGGFSGGAFCAGFGEVLVDSGIGFTGSSFPAGFGFSGTRVLVGISNLSPRYGFFGSDFTSHGVGGVSVFVSGFGVSGA